MRAQINAVFSVQIDINIFKNYINSSVSIERFGLL